MKGLFQGEIITEIAKIDRQLLKIFSRTTGPVSTNCVKGAQNFTNKGPLNSQKGDIDFFSLYQRINELVLCKFVH